MHRYYKAIGFNDIPTKKKERELLEDIKKGTPCEKERTENDEIYYEFDKKFGKNIGIKVCGICSEDEEFHEDYHFPYFYPETISTYSDAVLERRKDNEYYMGITEDPRLGIKLIYYVQNMIDYRRAFNDGRILGKDTSVSIAGLSLNGKILFPIKKTQEMIEYSSEMSKMHVNLVTAAQSGDSIAMQTLINNHRNTRKQINERTKTEDVFSIVETFIIPHGIESDEYSILGEILELEIIHNEETNVELYQMKLEVNHMIMHVCVPVEEVMGEPMVGRRYKGIIWLQGKLNFSTKKLKDIWKDLEIDIKE